MLPILIYPNMDSGSNSINTNTNTSHVSYNNIYDENIILNSVRNRKKVTELPNCPVCSCTIRQGELETHLNLELERLQKLSCGSKRKLSSVVNGASSSNQAMPGSSSNPDTDALDGQQMSDLSDCVGSQVYMRARLNRLQRLRSRRRYTPTSTSPQPQVGECPVCNDSLPVTRLQRHALRCLKRSGAQMDDDDVPDTSSEDGSIDVENDGPSGRGEGQESSGGGFGAEYRWCGEWRVRAAALQPSEARAATSVRRASRDHALVVDDDEDTALYGPPQYSPSRIANEVETEPVDMQTDHGADSRNSQNIESETNSEGRPQQIQNKPNGLVEASAETRIKALKVRIRELEKKQNTASETKCLICLGPHISPAVSIQCWHVHCEICWLESLKAKKICPQCNIITTTHHLRRIYM